MDIASSVCGELIFISGRNCLSSSSSVIALILPSSITGLDGSDTPSGLASKKVFILSKKSQIDLRLKTIGQSPFFKLIRRNSPSSTSSWYEIRE